MPRPTQARVSTAASEPGRSPLISEFRDHCRDFLRLSPATCQSYSADVRSLERWLAATSQAIPLSDVSPDDLRQYLQAQAHLSNATVARRIHAFSAFFKFLKAVGLRSDDPSCDLPVPRIHRPAVAFVDDNDLLRMIGVCRSPQEKTLLMTLGHAGLRRAELIALDLGDLDLDSRRLVVRCGKGGKGRSLPVVEELAQALRAHLASRSPGPTDALFTNSRGHRLAQTGLQRAFMRWVRDAGLRDKGYTIHGLRRGAATRWLRRGINLRDIQTLLGHASLQTVALYLEANVDTIARELDAKAPTISGSTPPAAADGLSDDVKSGLALLGRLAQLGQLPPGTPSADPTRMPAEEAQP